MNYQMDSNLLNKQYSVLVAGDVDLSIYDLTIPVAPYVVYEFNKRNDIRKQAINIYEELIKKLEVDTVNQLICQVMRIKLQDMREMTDEEYFEEATKGMMFDDNTGDALSTINPNGKFLTLSDPTPDTAVPLSGDKFICLAGDIVVKNIDKTLIEQYAQQWDSMMKMAPMVVDNYVKTYGDKEAFINVMTEPLFYNAFVSNETGWLEQGDENQVQWVLTFRERFINNLPKNTKLRVYNFTK